MDGVHKSRYIINDSGRFNWRGFPLFLLRRLWLPVLAAVIGVCAVFFTQEYGKAPVYRAGAMLFISSGRINEGTYYSPTDSAGAQQLAKLYQVLLTTDTMREQVREDFGDEAAAGLDKISLSVSAVEDTECMNLYVYCGDGDLAVEMCNIIAASAPSAVKDIVGAGSAKMVTAAGGAVRANPVSYRMSFLAAIGGVVVAVGILMTAFALDTSIKGVPDIRRSYGFPILGEIPDFAAVTAVRGRRTHKGFRMKGGA